MERHNILKPKYCILIETSKHITLETVFLHLSEREAYLIASTNPIDLESHQFRSIPHICWLVVCHTQLLVLLYYTMIQNCLEINKCVWAFASSTLWGSGPFTSSRLHALQLSLRNQTSFYYFQNYVHKNMIRIKKDYDLKLYFYLCLFFYYCY